MTNTYDLIVIGCGGFGSSVMFHAAKRGMRVLGLDQFPAAHDRGSSHGDTRIIRQAYFEHPDYVPLLLRAYELWRDLEAESGRSLMQICGLLEVGPPAGEVVTGVRLAAQLHGLPIENFNAAEIRHRFPGFAVDESFEGVFETTGGYLQVEDCVRTHIELALKHGATHEVAAVRSWASNGQTATVTTDRAAYEAANLVVTPGAWATSVLGPAAGLPQLEVRRKVLAWSPVTSNVYNETHGGVGFLFELPTGIFYGFPSIDGRTLKFAEHSGGETVAAPLSVDRSLRESDRAPLINFARNHLPNVDPSICRHCVCLYTMTPDGNFIVDRHREFENVHFGVGFSGHGFKFTSAIGEALANLAADGRTDLQLDFLGQRRFG